MILESTNYDTSQRKPEMATNIITEKIRLDDILEFDKLKYNSNNHYDKQPEDYQEKLQLTYAPHWIDKFKEYKKFTIDLTKYGWFYNAAELCSMTGKWSHFYDDELEQYLEENKTINDLFTNKKGYFVRCDNVSLKYGTYKCGPYTSLEMVIKSILTCIKGHTPMNIDQRHINVYLIDWITINKNYEFRVFVYNNRITCISQQHLYQVNKEKMTDDIVIKIKEHFETEIRPKITHIQDYTIDLFLDKIKTIVNIATHIRSANISKNTTSITIHESFDVYFIELNSFGKTSASGSALFHWIIDEDKLLNTENTIYFRYVV